MKDIAIYGVGGFGREIACVIKAINTQEAVWHLIGFFDDGVPVGTTTPYGDVLGNLQDLNAYHKELSIVLAIASPCIIRKIAREIINPKIEFPNILAPNVFLFDQESLVMGKGNVITFGGRLSCGITIGNFNLINGCTAFGHDVKLGNYNVLQPETRISGECTIGNENFFGARSMVLQGIQIGNNTRIGAGSIVMRKTKDNNLYFGIPAKIVKE